MKRKVKIAKSEHSVRKMIFQPSSGEPLWNPEDDESQLGGLLNWYSYNKSSDDAIKYFVSFIEKSNKPAEEIKHIKDLPKFSISNTLGWLARIVGLSEVPQKLSDRLEQEYKRLLTIGIEKVVEVKETPKQKPDVQKAIKEQLQEFLGSIEGELDDLLENNFKTKFVPIEFFKEKNLKLPHIKGIIDTYTFGLLKELKEVKSGKDEQLNEAYSFLSSSQINKYIKFVELILYDAEEYQKTLKTIQTFNRKPRAKKVKPAGKQVEKLKYLREHENIKSIMPSTIVGSTYLVVYNVKYRTLGVYQCNNPHGFSVKGSTILNFDVDLSVSKKLRKPELLLSKIDGLGKVAIRNLLSGIKAKEKKLTGRINSDTLLLRVL